MATNRIDEAHRAQQLKSDNCNAEVEKSLLKVEAYMAKRQHAEAEDRGGDDTRILTAEVSTRSAPTDHGLRDSIEESDSELVLEPLEHKPSAKRKTSRVADLEHVQKQRKVSNISWGGKDVIELSDDVSSESFGISSSREQKDGRQIEHYLQIDDLADQDMEHREHLS
ncbi:unnamed protein product [Zymoseptoria tritici ST99CH_1E4]|uniref:Uncharacterized protein n=1 Tax=Zymoseptoria tritici ST99CH_1E4 TaxID=1276532 RepID=A0A2H1GZ50_ZYMTR|nr:unnamed protein product [Zymoseptoria tritici ST99CH_1E4]